MCLSTECRWSLERISVLSLLLVIPTMFLGTGCRSDSEQARSKLDELGVRYSKASFFNRIERGDKRVVELFLTSGMEANAINSEGKSALVVAVRAAEKGIVKLLLGKGANPNGRDRREEDDEWTDVKNLGNSPLEAAHWSYTSTSESNEMMRKKYIEIMVFLVGEGADVDIEDKGGNTLLSSATVMLQTELVDLYLKHSADVNHVGSGGETPLTTVFDGPQTTDKSEKKQEVVRMLLEAGADANHQNHRGNTALMKAGTSDAEIVKLLLEYGASPNLKDLQGKTALLKTVETAVEMDEIFDDESGIENEKALVLARYGANVSRALSYLRNEGYEDFARKLIQASK